MLFKNKLELSSLVGCLVYISETIGVRPFEIERVIKPYTFLMVKKAK
jgi:hypothetical protein